MKRFERKSQVKNLLKKYGHIWVCGYILLYLPYFFWLESVITDNYKIMHVALDDMIPFSEYFIIPYIIWFYVSGAVLYFFFTDKQDYYRLCAFLFIGMTISMMICTFYPEWHRSAGGGRSTQKAFSAIWYRKSMTVIHQPMYFRAFMYTILWVYTSAS